MIAPVMKRIEYKLSVLDDVDFADFSFSVSTNPQPFRLKLKAKKFTNLKIILDNDEEAKQARKDAIVEFQASLSIK